MNEEEILKNKIIMSNLVSASLRDMDSKRNIHIIQKDPGIRRCNCCSKNYPEEKTKLKKYTFDSKRRYRLCQQCCQNLGIFW